MMSGNILSLIFPININDLALQIKASELGVWKVNDQIVGIQLYADDATCTWKTSADYD